VTLRRVGILSHETASSPAYRGLSVGARALFLSLPLLFGGDEQAWVSAESLRGLFDGAPDEPDVTQVTVWLDELRRAGLVSSTTWDACGALLQLRYRIEGVAVLDGGDNCTEGCVYGVIQRCPRHASAA
jgi:hypothetical protein